MGQKQTTAQFCLGIITKVYRMAYAYERDMINIKQRRHIHEKWKFGSCIVVHSGSCIIVHTGSCIVVHKSSL